MSYNIVWADDEIDTIFDELTQYKFVKSDVKVVKTFSNAKSLKDYIDNPTEHIDAIVVDANFPYEQFIANQEKDTLGLQMVSQWINSLKDKYAFILYTGRRNLIEDEIGKTIFSYFHENNLIVTKNPATGLSDLIAKIKLEVDGRNSPEWIVNNLYEKQLECFLTFDKICEQKLGLKSKSYELILGLLSKSISGELIDTERYLNDIRCDVFDNINSLAAHFGIVPPKLSLNDFSRLLCNMNVDSDKSKGKKYALKVKVLDEALYEPMRYVLRMIQDGSHNTPEHVRQYIATNNDTILIRSIMFTTIEIMFWFMNYLCEHTDVEINKLNWDLN